MYTITEINIPNGFSLIRVTDGHGTSRYGITAEFTNRFDGRWYIDIDVEKTWEYGNHNATLPNSITIRLMNGNVVVAEVVVTPDENGRWTHTFTDIPKHDADGNEIEYTIVELPIESWRPSYGGSTEEGFTIVNRYIPPAVIEDIPVQKVITGETPEQATQFRFTLTGQDNAPMPEGTTANGIKSISITGVGTGNFGSITFRTPGTFVYTIVEVNTGATGYNFDQSVFTLTIVVEEIDGALVITSRTLTRDGEPAQNVVFTNEYTGTPEPPSGTVILSGRKFWNHGTNAEASHPESITIIIFADGRRFITFALTAERDWRWTFEVPRYNDDGSVINWTVDEEDIPGYIKSIDGLNITNTHVSVDDPEAGPNDNDPSGRPPNQTGDYSNIWLWVSLTIASGGMILGMLIWIKQAGKNKEISVEQRQ